MSSQIEKNPPIDPWFDWITQRRQGGASLNSAQIRELERYRDRVLDGSDLKEGMTLVDMGTGDGLIAFGAIDRIGPSLQVILADISTPLLRRAAEIAEQRGVIHQCTFIAGSAEKCLHILNACTDVVTTRSVLAYVPNKAAAATEFYRILKPGGRVSIAEPIYRDASINLANLAQRLTTLPKNSQLEETRLFLKWNATQFPSTVEEIYKNPLTNFNEHDLFSFFEDAGFADVHVELHIDRRNQEITSWETFLDSSTRPNAPTLREILMKHFTTEEKDRFEASQRPLIENGKVFYRSIMAYLTATKPLSE